MDNVMSTDLIGKTHTAAMCERVAEARRNIEDGVYDRPDVIEATAIILRRTLAALDESELRCPYRDREHIEVGEDERDQT